MCERWAYYGWFIRHRLPDIDGWLQRHQAGYLTGIFAALCTCCRFCPGAIADRIGYRPNPDAGAAAAYRRIRRDGTVPIKHVVLLPMALVMCGGALVKPIITGTVARASTPPPEPAL